MLPPFELLTVSWPQPAQVHHNRWASEPAWDAPAMQFLPRWKVLAIDESPCWSIDWRDFFRTGVRTWDPYQGGEMKGFHVVFRVRMCKSGRLLFWDDDGSIVRYQNEIIHDDRSAHSLVQHEIEVRAGDILEIAQWQLGWDWMWCGRIQSPGAPDPRITDEFLERMPIVEQQLRIPTGPPLKMYTNGQSPLRVLASIYSMVLNGYTPSQICLFGEEQWSPRTRELFRELLPFAQVVSHDEALRHIRLFGGSALAELSRKHWFVMKAFVALAMPPLESCLMDDDVFILDQTTDALEAFTHCDLVYTPDQDLADGYANTWRSLLGRPGPIPTGRFNAGLYWIRNIPQARAIASAALRSRPDGRAPFLWEQGLIAVAYANRPTFQLPNQRYLFPLFDGLPGGVHGYDYAENPCGFASIHFGGLAEKPSDALAVQLLAEIVDRRRNVQHIKAAIA